MEKRYAWMAKHKLLANILGSLFLCGVYTWLLVWLDAPIWLIILLDAFLIFLNYAAVEQSPMHLLKKPLAELNDNCNPVPFGLELEKLLKLKNSKSVQQTLLLNYAVALRNIGNYEKNYEILRSINIDKSAQTLPITKVVYYNNLMDACMILEKYEEACVWYSKMTQIYADMKPSKQKRNLEETVRAAEADYYFCKKEYDKAMQILETVVAPCRRAKVESTYFSAKVCIALGDVDQAKEKLIYVMQNGNKLICVEEAKKLLEEMNEPQEIDIRS